MPVIFSALTVAAYLLSLKVRRRWQNPTTTPVLTTFAFVLVVLVIGRIPYAVYKPGGAIISAWLAPATASLAVLIFRHREMLLLHLSSIIAALSCGFASSLACALLFAHALGLPAALSGLLVLKSVTVAISSQLAPLVHVPTALVAVVVIASGVIGATIGPVILDAVGVDDQRSRGLALGAISHGIGTAQAATESDTAAAASSLAMCTMALMLCTVGLPIVISVGRWYDR